MTVEQLEIKHWLNRAFYADKKTEVLKMRVQQCRERAQGFSVCYEGNDRGKTDGSKNGTENALMRLADMEMKLTQQIIELLDITDEISEAISKLNDNDLETVLIHRYILFHTIEQTAELMHYTPRTVRRKQAEAIEKMSSNVLVCPPKV